MSKYLIIIFLFVFSSAYADKISLKVIGDKSVGYSVDVYYGSMPVSKQNKTGELNLYVENEDYSIREYIKNWKATSFTQQDHRIVLSGDVDLKKLGATLRV